MIRRLTRSFFALAALAVIVAVAFSCCLALGFAWADEEPREGVLGNPIAEEQASGESATTEETGDEASDESESDAEQSSSESSTAATPGSNANIVDPTQRADNSFIYDTSIGSLFDESSLYDERIVQVEGEVIGDRIIDTTSPNHCWIELASMDEDDSSNISVWISKEQTDQIDRYGRYGVTGTHFQVRGIYHQACSEHEGLSDIHATASSVLAVGIEHPDVFNPSDFSIPLVLVFIGVVLLVVFRIVRERMR